MTPPRWHRPLGIALLLLAVVMMFGAAGTSDRTPLTWATFALFALSGPVGFTGLVFLREPKETDHEAE